MTLLGVLSSCRPSDKYPEALLSYVNDDAHYVALCNLSVFELPDGNPDRPPIASLTDRALTFYDPWCATFYALDGIDRTALLVMGDRYYLPLNRAMLFTPVIDADLLGASLLKLGYTPAGGNHPHMYLAPDCCQRTALIDGEIVCFLAGRNVDSIANRVAELKEAALAKPLSKWKRDFLADRHLADCLISGNFYNSDLGIASVEFSLEGDRMTARTDMHDFQGNHLRWADPADQPEIDPDVVGMLPDDCMLTAAFTWGHVVNPHALAEKLLPVPQKASPVYDSLRVALSTALDAVTGTTAASISFRGNNVLSLTSYDLSLAARVRPGTAARVCSDFTNLLPLAGMPAEGSLTGATSTEVFGVPLMFMPNAANNTILAHLGPNDRVITSHRDADVKGLIGYAVADITPVGPFANAVGHPMKLQVQLRIDYESLTVNAVVNEEAVDVINNALNILSNF